MDQNIKNFDRRIEQLMNENAVVPPHGMWNRISAELSAEVLPPVASAPASAIPGRAMVGFFAGALILGATFVTAYLANNTAIQPVQQDTPAKEISIDNIVSPKNVEQVVPIDIPTPALVTTAKTTKSAKLVAVKEPEGKTTEMLAFQSTSEVAVPNQTIGYDVVATNDPYYFPPVDIITPEPTTMATSLVEMKNTKEVEPKAEERKIRTTGSSERKLKFKKKRSSSFSYGRLNRLKNPK